MEKPMPAAISVMKLAQKRTFSLSPGSAGPPGLTERAPSPARFGLTPVSCWPWTMPLSGALLIRLVLPAGAERARGRPKAAARRDPNWCRGNGLAA